MPPFTGPVLTLEAFDNSASAQTDTELIAAQAGKKIAVYQVYVTAKQATTVTFECGAVTKHVQYAGAGGGSVLPYTGIPWFIGAYGEALTYTTSAAGGCAVRVKAAAV